jgi:hypothetical protein
MSKDEQTARWERFARMRLEDRSDVTYRAYDLLTKERKPGNALMYMKAAGVYVPHGRINEILTMYQRMFMDWGFGVLTLGQIESLLHEFWIYQRIRWGGKKNWPYRDPDEARALYDQNEKATKLYKELEAAHGIKAIDPDDTERGIPSVSS